MTERARILLVGLDACDPGTALDLAARGRMPALKRLMDSGAQCSVRNPFGLFVSGLWATFATGLRPDRHTYHCWDEIDVGSYRRRLTTPARIVGTPFWRRLSEAGRRIAVVDVPHSRADTPIGGVQVVEWGCHDRHFGFHTWPVSEAARIERFYGLHPTLGMDAHTAREFAPDDYTHRAGARRTPAEERRLLAGLLRGVEAKCKLSAALLAEGGWDLFLTIFGESHAVGHQQWHLHDPGHPRFDAATVRAVGGDPVSLVYERLDAAFGELLSRVDGRTTVLLFLSHGMGAHHDGTHLLDRVLRRIDLADRAGLPGGQPGDIIGRAMQVLFGETRRRGQGLTLAEARGRVAQHLPRPCREFVRPRARARQRFFLEPNNFVYGGVRLNLAGREPQGRVRREDVNEVIAQLTRDLCALINLDTGLPAIRGVERADRYYRRTETDTMPDLFIDWEREAPIETVWSEKVGLVHAPYVNWRTGDHRPGGLLIATGPGVPPGALLPEMPLEDLAPSLAARL
ncbi:MAG: hypothetical protein QOK29_163, partial [Rhodospirillaceae bacterium]|nr:hypothetical protein [Rhodospirillaceae bacterium]